MSRYRPSLIDVLMPPVNPWLDEISKHKATLPAGVCVVRLSDDEGDDQPDQSPPPRPRRVATEQEA